MNLVGSVWTKWDLHIHTPASFHWKGKKFSDQTPEERDETCKAIFDRMNELDIDAFCVMDYWTFDGYVILRDYRSRHPEISTKCVFPGIELRLEAPTNHRLNTHVLLSDAVLPETLNQFLAQLRMGGPSGKPPGRQNFIDIAKAYDNGKFNSHGFKPEHRANDDKMCELGMMTAEVTRESLSKAIELVKDKCFLIQPYDTSDGLEELDWKRHPYTDSTLMKWADIFETRDPVHVGLFLGFGLANKPHVGPDFIHNLGGNPKPVVSGSDGHKIADYGIYPSERITWLKAQPTFEGLKQVCIEPALRCFIGKVPPKLEHILRNPTRYIKQLTIEKLADSRLEEHWFENVEISLNPGLVAIIGNKGSGKSALADILALGGNAHCREMEFLNPSRFRRSDNKAKDFKATLTWTDGTAVSVTLDQEPDFLQPERIRYLPQHFIEKLCNEISAGKETNFEKELKKVIFSHVPEDKRLQKDTLDELLAYTVEAHKKAISQLQGKVKSTNEEILRVEEEISDERIKSYKTSLKLKETELEAHDGLRPASVDEPAKDPDDINGQEAENAIKSKQQQLESLQGSLDGAKAERTSLIARKALLSRLSGHVNNLESAYLTFVADNKAEFESAGIQVEQVVSLTINQEILTGATTTVTDRLAHLAVLINGNDTTVGLEAQQINCRNDIATLQDALNAPQKIYQAYLSELKSWEARRSEIVGTAEKPDTIEYFTNRIRRAESILPQELEQLRNERLGHVRGIHKELLAIREGYQEAYKPVQQIATSTEFTKDSLLLQFDAFLTPQRFEDNFLDFISRNRKGTFYGDDDSRKAIRALLEPHDFNSPEAVVAFVESLMVALTSVDRDGTREPVAIQSQIKANKKIGDLYDFIFGLEYLEPRYTLSIGGKDISQLSPGEKGALLLVFYLLLDKDEIPIIIDQPEHNLDNESVVKLLVDCIRHSSSRRQVIIVTHNPNLAVFCDADQLICSSIDRPAGNRISYSTGAIEDFEINKTTVDVLEGTYPAFDNRRRKYHKQP